MTLETFLQDNKKTIDYLARHFANKNPGLHDYDDLRQEATIATINAYNSPKINKERSFNYVYRAIFHHLIMVVNASQSPLSIRPSGKLVKKITKIHNMEGEGDSPEKICGELGITAKQYTRLRGIFSKTELSADHNTCSPDLSIEIFEIIEGMPEDIQQVMRMHIEGQDLKKIAERYGKSYRWALYTLKNGLEQLKGALDEH